MGDSESTLPQDDSGVIRILQGTAPTKGRRTRSLESKERQKAYRREWWRKNWRKYETPERKAKKKARRSKIGNHLWTRYRLRLEEYDALVVAQNNCCGICGGSSGKRNLVIDHDHATGHIRGLLHISCNAALGNLGDNEEGILKVLEYLRKQPVLCKERKVPSLEA